MGRVIAKGYGVPFRGFNVLKLIVVMVAHNSVNILKTLNCTL